MSNLSTDVLRQIFLRMPLQTIAKSAQLCKKWNAALDNTEFWHKIYDRIWGSDSKVPWHHIPNPDWRHRCKLRSRYQMWNRSPFNKHELEMNEVKVVVHDMQHGTDEAKRFAMYAFMECWQARRNFASMCVDDVRDAMHMDTQINLLGRALPNCLKSSDESVQLLALESLFLILNAASLHNGKCCI